MSELLRDSVYKRFLETKPRLPDNMSDKKMAASPPWVVYVQLESDGPWGRRDFWKYGKALKFLLKKLEGGAHDAALNCKRFPTEPPNRFARIRGKYIVGSDGIRRQATKAIPWQPRMEPGDPDHHWCKYCRRPTVFKYYSKHKRMGQVDSTVPRCCICGASARIALPAGDRLARIS